MKARLVNDDQDNIKPCWQETSIKSRLIVFIIAILFWAVLVVAWNVNPAPDGYGSHQQIGIPKCQWIKESNTPCPTCGMTTAYSLTVRVRLISAMITQPAGTILAITHIFLTGLFSIIAVRGKYPVYFTAWANYNTIRIIIIYVIIILIGWGITYLRIKY